MRRLTKYALVGLLALSAPLAAQEDDTGGFLVGFLEDNLSGDNRLVKVTGLEGALSSQATIRQLTVSDDDGVWLTVKGAVLDWNRLALLKGRFSVNTLSAQEIIIARRPGQVETETTLPTPEAQPFKLPEFPVAIELGKIEVARLELDKEVLGIAAELKMTGALQLAGGALDTNLDIQRLDRPGDTVGLVAKYENETSLITLDLTVNEDENGLIATALKIPGRPDLQLTAKGKGPVSDFTADIDLSTAGTSRITGKVRLQEADKGGAEPAPGIAFEADLGGDVAALLAEDYKPFFGPDTRLSLAGKNHADGRLEIDEFDISSDALDLNGTLKMTAEGAVGELLVTGRIAAANGAEVVLPMTGPRTAISGADLSVRFKASDSNKWKATATVDDLSRPDLSLGRVSINADGTLDQNGGRDIRGRFSTALERLELTDGDLNGAVGPTVSLTGNFALNDENGLELSQVAMLGTDYSAQLDGRLSGLESGFFMQGRLRLDATDLSRFSGLAGRPLGGAVNAVIDGNGAPLGGQFDFRLDMQAQDLRSGIEQIDTLIQGQTTLSLDAERGTEGLRVNSFRLDGTALSASAQGSLSSAGSRLTFEAALDDLARVVPETSGPLKLRGDVEQNKNGELSGNVRVSGPQSSFLELDGTLDPNGPASLSYVAELDRIERFVPEMSGSVTSKGTARREGSLWTIEGRARAAADFTARLAGTWDEATGTSHLKAKGEVQMAIANRLLKPNSIVGLIGFDLSLDGRTDLAGLKGTVTTKNAKFVLPAFAQSLENINTKATISKGRANLSVTATLAAGGTIRAKGPITLTPPFKGNITADLQQLVLTDNLSFRSLANGQIVFAGPLTGNANLSGRINFSEAEINLNTASGSVGAAPIPEITHLNEPANVRATRERAGLIKTDDSGGGPVIGLNLTLSAPNRVFARGRGIQAELGGQITVGGTTANVVPAGQIGLIRGNMNLLGRNLKLTKGLVTLQDKLQPYVEFAATTSTSEGSATIEISGPIDGPRIEVYSEPERPSEEALAMLIFGNRFAEISPLALAQMATSLSELTGHDSAGLLGRGRKGKGTDGDGEEGDGRNLLDKVYTDFTVNTRGDTELNLNLDISDNVTLKGTVDQKGETAVGIFFERDY